MKSKRLFQIFVLLTLVFSTMGANQPVLADTNSVNQPDALIISHDLTYWNATYIGYINSSLYEKWQLVLTESHNFAVTAGPITGGLTPLLILSDANGSEITRATGTLTTTQSAGSYFIQIQPESGSGFYVLTVREVIVSQPSVSTLVTPASVNVGDAAAVTVNLNNVPAEGYTSAEFTCTYDGSLAQESNIVVTGLFGADAVTAIKGPQNGSFIVAIAGSNGNKAMTGGEAFSFSLTGLSAGQTAVECTARVSKGDNVLTDLTSISAASLTVFGDTPTPTFTPTPEASATPTFSPTPTSSPTEGSSPTPTSSPTEGPSPTPTASSTEGPSPTPTASPTETSSPAPTFSPTPDASATPTPQPNGILTGQVLASKPVTVSLYNTTNELSASMTANTDGTFSLTAPAGTYTVIAAASGFLSAQGSVNLTGGNTSTKPTISLPAGDIDNNNVIDQFDAMTIGMSYNTASPAAADLNNDGVINVLDLELLAHNYRKSGSLAWE